MAGVLPSPTFDDYWFRPERYSQPKWQARSWGLLDSSKDIQAYKDARELQLETHDQQISNYTGEGFTNTIDKIASENKYKEKMGLLSPIDDPAKALEAKKPAAAPPQPPEDDDKSDGDDD